MVAMPKRPVNHIQNTAPGPPKVIAVATPTMLPIPTVAARAVMRVENCEISPLPESLEKIILKASGSDRNCRPLNKIVR